MDNTEPRKEQLERYLTLCQESVTKQITLIKGYFEVAAVLDEQERFDDLRLCLRSIQMAIKVAIADIDEMERLQAELAVLGGQHR